MDQQNQILKLRKQIKKEHASETITGKHRKKCYHKETTLLV